jgi:hypothetical protein
MNLGNGKKCERCGHRLCEDCCPDDSESGNCEEDTQKPVSGTVVKRTSVQKQRRHQVDTASSPFSTSLPSSNCLTREHIDLRKAVSCAILKPEGIQQSRSISLLRGPNTTTCVQTSPFLALDCAPMKDHQRHYHHEHIIQTPHHHHSSHYVRLAESSERQEDKQRQSLPVGGKLHTSNGNVDNLVTSISCPEPDILHTHQCEPQPGYAPTEPVECHGYPRTGHHHARANSPATSGIVGVCQHCLDDCQCESCQSAEHSVRCCVHESHTPMVHHHQPTPLVDTPSSIQKEGTPESLCTSLESTPAPINAAHSPTPCIPHPNVDSTSTSSPVSKMDVDRSSPNEPIQHVQIEATHSPTPKSQHLAGQDRISAYGRTPMTKPRADRSGPIIPARHIHAEGPKSPLSKEFKVDEPRTPIKLTKRSSFTREARKCVLPVPASEEKSRNFKTFFKGNRLKQTTGQNVGKNISGNYSAAHSPGGEFCVDPLPASSGAVNPIHLQPGEKVPHQIEYTNNTITSGIHDDHDLFNTEKRKSQMPVPPPCPRFSHSRQPYHLAKPTDSPKPPPRRSSIADLVSKFGGVSHPPAREKPFFPVSSSRSNHLYQPPSRKLTHCQSAAELRHKTNSVPGQLSRKDDLSVPVCEPASNKSTPVSSKIPTRRQGNVTRASQFSSSSRSSKGHGTPFSGKPTHKYHTPLSSGTPSRTQSRASDHLCSENQSCDIPRTPGSFPEEREPPTCISAPRSGDGSPDENESTVECWMRSSADNSPSPIIEPPPRPPTPIAPPSPTLCMPSRNEFDETSFRPPIYESQTLPSRKRVRMCLGQTTSPSIAVRSRREYEKSLYDESMQYECSDVEPGTSHDHTMQAQTPKAPTFCRRDCQSRSKTDSPPNRDGSPKSPEQEHLTCQSKSCPSRRNPFRREYGRKGQSASQSGGGSVTKLKELFQPREGNHWMCSPRQDIVEVHPTSTNPGSHEKSKRMEADVSEEPKGNLHTPVGSDTSLAHTIVLATPPAFSVGTSLVGSKAEGIMAKESSPINSGVSPKPKRSTSCSSCTSLIRSSTEEFIEGKAPAAAPSANCKGAKRARTETHMSGEKHDSSDGTVVKKDSTLEHILDECPESVVTDLSIEKEHNLSDCEGDETVPVVRDHKVVQDNISDVPNRRMYDDEGTMEEGLKSRCGVSDTKGFSNVDISEMAGSLSTCTLDKKQQGEYRVVYCGDHTDAEACVKRGNWTGSDKAKEYSDERNVETNGTPACIDKGESKAQINSKNGHSNKGHTLTRSKDEGNGRSREDSVSGRTHRNDHDHARENTGKANATPSSEEMYILNNSIPICSKGKEMKRVRGNTEERFTMCHTQEYHDQMGQCECKRERSQYATAIYNEDRDKSEYYDPDHQADEYGHEHGHKSSHDHERTQGHTDIYDNEHTHDHKDGHECIWKRRFLEQAQYQGIANAQREKGELLGVSVIIHFEGRENVVINADLRDGCEVVKIGSRNRGNAD